MTDWLWIRPEWLWALIPWLALAITFVVYQPRQESWHQLIAPHLQQRLLKQTGKSRSSAPLVLLATLITILALAGPSVRSQETPLYSTEQARVLILDMTLSVWSTDVTPNRLTRLRYKAMDFVNASRGGSTGLIAYAGDAFVVSPLTSDGKTLNNLIAALAPDVMPAFGSRPEVAIEKAIALLSQAGHQQGSLVLMTDGIREEKAKIISELLAKTNYQLNIYQLGTEQGAPIQLPSGELYKSAGKIVVPTADLQISRRLSQESGGTFVSMSHDNRDIERLAKASENQANSEAKRDQKMAQVREDAGPYLLLLLAPLLLLLFRKGALIALAGVVLYQPAPAQALEWQALWKTQEQRAQEAFEQGDFASASELSEDPLRKGNALYRQGDFAAATAEYEKLTTATGHYNRGNALAQQQKLDEAISAYEKALELDPMHEDAQKNKALLKQLQDQQQDQQRQNSEDQPQGDDSQQQDQNAEGDQKDSEQESQNDKDQQSEPSDSNEQDQNSSSESEQQNSENQNAQEQSEQEQQGSESQSEQQNSENQSEQSQSELQEDLAQQSQRQQQAAQAAKDQEQPSEPETDLAPQIAMDQAEQGESEQVEPMDVRLQALPDDPAVLLRNKMQLEYRKRQAEGTLVPEKQVW